MQHPGTQTRAVTGREGETENPLKFRRPNFSTPLYLVRCRKSNDNEPENMVSLVPVSLTFHCSPLLYLTLPIYFTLLLFIPPSYSTDNFVWVLGILSNNRSACTTRQQWSTRAREIEGEEETFDQYRTEIGNFRTRWSSSSLAPCPLTYPLPQLCSR